MVQRDVLLQALAMVPMYLFPVDAPITYHVAMRFDGFLPILGVGEGKAEVNGTFQVLGKTANTATVSLTAFDVSFNGGKIPIDLDDAQKYVPGGTFTYTRLGVVSGWNAPNVAAPIRIPGLDLQHLPEVLFLPIVFPSDGVDNRPDGFKFSRPLSGGTADCTVKFSGAGGSTGGYSAGFRLKVHQSYSDFEDDANQVVPEKDAAMKVVTEVVGTGTATFSSPGQFTSFEVDDVATSTATDLQTKKVTTRKLSRHMEVKSN